MEMKDEIIGRLNEELVKKDPPDVAHLRGAEEVQSVFSNGVFGLLFQGALEEIVSLGPRDEVIDGRLLFLC